MARPRKNAPKPDTQALSFVPVEEQPYPLPEGWKWVRLGELYQINPKSKAEDDTLASFVPMEKINPGMKGTFSFEVQPWGKIKKGHTQFENGDVAFAKISPCFENGKSMLVQGLKNGLGAGTTELIILRQPDVAQKYTFYLVSSSDFIQKGTQTYSGTVGQQRINMDFVRNYPVPLPPLDEQERIVTRIDSLFAKLDEAKEKAEAVLDTFETRKAAILHKAFTGELTAKWREERGIEKESWKKLLFSALGSSKLGKMLDKQKNKGTLTPYLRNINVRWFSFDLSDIAEMLATPEEVKQLSVKQGDLFICEGGEPGRCAVWKDKEHPLIFQKALHRFRPNRFASSDFLCFFLNYYAMSGKLDEFFTGTTIKHLTGQSLAKIQVHTPTLPEQQEITRILDNLLEKEQQSKEAAETVLEQIDLMKKAILAKAFRGELG